MEVKVISFTIKIAALVLCYVFVAEVEADYRAADFPKTVRSKLFVDKTLMLQNFVNNPKSKVIVAPSRSGKSTILDMVERFFGIPLKKKEKKKNKEERENYKLFCEKKLKICENDTFVEKHMAQYPVIRVDFWLLNRTHNFTHLLDLLRATIFNTFTIHRYLLDNVTLWNTDDEKKLFSRHVHLVHYKSLNYDEVFNAFTFLGRMLYEQFNRRVIVLLDDYDAFFGKQLLRNIDDERKISRFLLKMIKSLLNDNIYLERAMITGVIRIKDIGVMCQTKSGKNVYVYNWLAGHRYTNYYGVTTDEVVQLLRMLKKEETEVKGLQKKIENECVGYRVLNQDATIYSLWSILNFFKEKRKRSQYWKESDWFHELMSRTMKNDNIRNEITGLTTNGQTIKANVTSPLSAIEIANLKNSTETAEKINSERLYVILYDFGFLTTTGEFSKSSLLPLKIPNFEMQVEFSKLLAMPYIMKYKNETNSLPSADQVMSLVAPGQSSAQYKPFFESIRYIISNIKV